MSKSKKERSAKLEWQRLMMSSPNFRQIPGWRVLFAKMLRKAREKPENNMRNSR